MIQFLDFSLTLLTFVCVALMMTWLFYALTQAGLSTRRGKIVGVTSAIVLLWLLFTAILAHVGILQAWTTLPPRLPLLPLSVLVSLILVNRTALFGASS